MERVIQNKYQSLKRTWLIYWSTKILNLEHFFLLFFPMVVAWLLKLTYSKLLTPWTDPFIITIMKAFGFNDIFWNWINLILHSAKHSINVNANLEGVFSCTRGVRQGDPLSPLLFCSAEEVLSRGITKLVFENSPQPMLGPSSLPMPSHFL